LHEKAMKTSNNNNLELRIGAVSYLNTKPLVYGLAERLPDAELVFDFPSRLADALAAGELDIALVPSAELFGHPEWSVVSDACIACRGPVLSVKLLFRLPPQQVRTLALDEGSRTSAILSRILLRELAGVRPRLTTLPLGHKPADVDADAVLVIGDRAIRSAEAEFVEVWDLGDRWCRWAELPFVFAMWVARPGVDTTVAEKALAETRDHGCQNLAQIAREQSLAMQLPYDLVFEYLSRNLHFELGVRERRGFSLFREKSCQLSAISYQPENSKC
jgi:chorismate dehydratase